MKVSAFVATSLDGYIARADGSLDWQAGGAGKAASSEYGFSRFYQSVDLMIVGRHTFARHLSTDVWPYGTKRMVVMSRNYVEIPVTLARYVESSNLAPHALLTNLARKQVAHVYVDGGVTIQSFLHAGLISEITLTRIPVLLGQGIALFSPSTSTAGVEHRLEHLHTQSFADGAVQSRYRLARTTQ